MRSRRRLAPLLLVAALLFGPPADLAAQDSATIRITVGDDVKLRSRVLSGRFRVSALDSARLTLAGANSVNHVVEIESLSSLKVARGMNTRGRGAWRGFVRGAAIGAVFGAAAGLADGDDDPGFLAFSAGEKAVLGAVVGGGFGGTVGLTVGAIYPGERWVKVPLATLRSGVSPDGVATIGVAIRF